MGQCRRHLEDEYAVVVLGATIAGVGAAVAASRTLGRDKVLLLEDSGEIGGEYLSTYRPVFGLEHCSPADPLARSLLEELRQRRAVIDGILQPVTLLPVLSHLLKGSYPLTLYNTRLTGITTTPLSTGKTGWKLELYQDGVLSALCCAAVFDTTYHSDSCRSKEELPCQLWFNALVELPESGRDRAWFVQTSADGVSLEPYAIADYWILRMKLEKDDTALARDRLFRYWKERPASMDKAVLVGVASQAERVFSGIPLRADEGEAKRLLLPEGYASDPIAALDKGILYMTSLVSDE